MTGGALQFETFTLDPGRRELRRDGVPVALGPQVFDLLLHLVRARDHVVSKDELIETVWKGRIVSESTLTSTINAVRKALGDTGKDQRLIRTASRKGIRFVGEVRTYAGASPAPPGPDRSLVQPDRSSIAVLPFANMGGDPEQAYFADGITEDIITALSKWRWFFVIARNSTFTYKGRSVDVREVAHELGVRYVLEGSVRKSGDRVRITAQLIDAETGAHVWAERYDDTLDDVFDLQDRLCASIVGALEPQLKVAELQRIRQKRPENLEAYDFYLQALPAFYAQTRTGNAQARALLASAIACDPGYATAHAFLAYCHQQRRQQGWSESVAAEEREGLASAERAVALAPDDPTVLWIAGHMFTALARDRTRGRALIDRSLALNANCAQAWGVSGLNHMYSGHEESAIDHFHRAMRLSPVDPLRNEFYGGIAGAYMGLGQFDRMVEAAETSVQLGPNYSSNWRFLVVALAYSNRPAEAGAAVRRLLELEPGLTVAIVGQTRTSQVEPRMKKMYLDGLRLAGLPEG